MSELPKPRAADKRLRRHRHDRLLVRDRQDPEKTRREHSKHSLNFISLTNARKKRALPGQKPCIDQTPAPDDRALSSLQTLSRYASVKAFCYLFSAIHNISLFFSTKNQRFVLHIYSFMQISQKFYILLPRRAGRDIIYACKGKRTFRK